MISNNIMQNPEDFNRQKAGDVEYLFYGFTCVSDYF